MGHVIEANRHKAVRIRGGKKLAGTVQWNGPWAEPLLRVAVALRDLALSLATTLVLALLLQPAVKFSFGLFALPAVILLDLPDL